MMAPFLALALAVTPASPPLKVAGPWTVEFADKVCAMARPYASSGGQVTLLIKAPLVGRGYAIYVIRPGIGVKPEVWRDAYIVKAGGAKVGPFPLQAYTSRANKRVVRFSADPDKYKLTEDGDTLAFDFGKEGIYSFPVPRLAKALLTLETCSKGLRKAFGIEQETLDRMAIEPKSIGFIFRSDDYPIDASRSGQQGEVAVLTFIEADGRVSECHIIESSGVQSLDAKTCSVLKARGRYEPARDSKGEAMRVPFSTRTRWVLPR